MNWHDDGHTITVVLRDGGPTFMVTCPNQTYTSKEVFSNVQLIDPNAPCAFEYYGCVVQEEVYAVGPDWDMIEMGDEFVVDTESIPVVWYLWGHYDSFSGEWDGGFKMRLKWLHDELTKKDESAILISEEPRS